MVDAFQNATFTLQRLKNIKAHIGTLRKTCQDAEYNHLYFK
jgi:hypothetical protein